MSGPSILSNTADIFSSGRSDWSSAARSPMSKDFNVSIGGQPATVQYDGLAPTFTGLYQSDITVPNVRAGNAALSFTLAGPPSTNALHRNR